VGSTERKRPSDVWLILLLAVGIFLWQRTAIPLWMVDLFHIQYAAYEFRAGEIEWMYSTDAQMDKWLAHREPVAQKLGAEGTPNADYYPPFFPAILAPVSNVPARVWRDVLFAVNIVLHFFFAWLIVYLCRVPVTWRSILWGLVPVFLSYPMSRAVELGQTLPLFSALTWIALLLMQNDKQFAGGVILGIVSSIKLFPAGFILIPFVERKFRAVWTWIITGLVIYGVSVPLLGTRIWILWWDAFRDLSSNAWAFFGNQSLSGWYMRVILGYSFRAEHFPPPPSVLVLRAVACLIFGGITLWVLGRRWQDRNNDLFVPRAGVVICGILLILPVAWEHYWLFALPALGWAIHEVWTKRDARFWELWLAVAAFFCIIKLNRFYGDDSFRSLITGNHTIGLLMLWTWFVRRLWNPAHNASLAPAER
jgi:hypothetical protein